jgi:hypothetical protein
MSRTRPKLTTAALLAAPFLLAIPTAKAERPVAVYAFPAGGQRGADVAVRVGGLFFHGEAGFTVSGPGVSADPVAREIPRVWFEGPMIYQPASQRSEDYPRDHAAVIRIDSAAVPGIRRWHCRTSQGVTASLPFIVGDLPEIVEAEIDGEPVPVPVKAPVTINGRIFPRQDRDIWEIEAAAGEWITGEVLAKQLGYPIDPSITISDESARPVRADTVTLSGDPRFAFQAPHAGRYRIEVSDGNFSGGQDYIYRLSLRRGPVATALFPLGGKRGDSVALEFFGPALPKPVIQTVALAGAAGGWLPVSHGEGPTFHLQIGDDPEVIENPGKPLSLPLPGVANGRISKGGETDEWILDLKKDQTVQLELFAASLGSRLDSRVSVIDGAGAELAQNDDAAPGNPDSLLVFTAPQDGQFRARVSDRFASRGGPDFAYRLGTRLLDKGDFRLIAATDAITIVRDLPPTGEAAPEPVDPKAKPPNKPRIRGSGLTVNLEPLGAFKSDVMLEVLGLPEGVTVDESGAKIAFARKTTDLHFDAAPDCPLQQGEIRLRGTAEVDGQKIVREVALPLRVGETGGEAIRFAVAPAVPFSFVGEYWVETGYPVGSRLTKTFRLDRGGFDGPLRVELSDRQIRHLQGVSGGPAEIPPGAEQFTYTANLPPRMEMGRTCRVQLMISGEITDIDGTRHRVSYTNQSPEQQMMSIVSEGRLHLTTGATSVRVTPNQKISLSATVKRDPSLAALPLRLELAIPETASDIAFSPVELPPGAESAEIEIGFGPNPGPFLQPLKLRASTVSPDPAKQHETEIELELVSIQQG